MWYQIVANTSLMVTWYLMWYQEKSENTNRSGKLELSEQLHTIPDYWEGQPPGKMMTALIYSAVKTILPWTRLEHILRYRMRYQKIKVTNSWLRRLVLHLYDENWDFEMYTFLDSWGHVLSEKKKYFFKKSLIGNPHFLTSWWLIMNILNILRYKILWVQFLSLF